MKRYKIALIGTGNVAWHLQKALEGAGHVITEIYGRNLEAAEAMVYESYMAEATDSPDFSESEAEVFLLALSDAAVEPFAQEIVLPDNAILAHTSGTLAAGVLGYAATEHFGVFYPLQTFTKGKNLDFEEVPLCIEGETSHAEKVLSNIAHSVSQQVHQIDSRQRKILHLAAVFACNFTNHLFTISKGILENSDMNFELLQPLIVETLNKSLEIGPENAQTGPAIRQDLPTLERQAKSLESDEQVSAIYQLLSQHIMDYYED